MFTAILNACKNFLNRIKEQVKKLTKPATATLAASALSDLRRSKSDLIIENAILRQQLIVLKRSVKRPKFTPGDRIRLTFLARLTNFWHSALHIVQPETILRWHRDLFRGYWRRKSKPKSRKPRIPLVTINLIKQMASDNRRWGAKKIRGELLKLDIKVHKRTIQRYLRQVRKRNSGQNWATFLRNHAQDIWCCDFTVVHTLLFKPLYIFVIMHHQTRRIVHAAVTTHPTDEWTTQQLREATPWGQKPKYLIRDNDGKYGAKFKAFLDSMGIEDKNTPIRAPRANALCERFIGTLRRECLNHHLILHQHQLRRVVNEFVAYYNHSRPHQGIDQDIPILFGQPRPPLTNKPKGKVIATPVLNGLHHSYAYAGAVH
jgi:transposase InsO family protein